MEVGKSSRGVTYAGKLRGDWRMVLICSVRSIGTYIQAPIGSVSLAGVTQECSLNLAYLSIGTFIARREPKASCVYCFSSWTDRHDHLLCRSMVLTVYRLVQSSSFPSTPPIPLLRDHTPPIPTTHSPDGHLQLRLHPLLTLLSPPIPTRILLLPRTPLLRLRNRITCLRLHQHAHQHAPIGHTLHPPPLSPSLSPPSSLLCSSKHNERTRTEGRCRICGHTFKLTGSPNSVGFFMAASARLPLLGLWLFCWVEVSLGGLWVEKVEEEMSPSVGVGAMVEVGGWMGC